MSIKKNSSFHLFIIAVVCCLFCSCISSKKAKVYKAVTQEAENVYQQSLDSLRKADSVRDSKFNQGGIDKMSNEMISDYIDSLIKISMNHMKDDSIMGKTKLTHRNFEFVLAKAYRIVQDVKKQLDNVKLINELLSTNTFTQFSMSSLFESGEYMLDGDNKQKAILAFQPVVEDILKFVEKFPGKKMSATIVVIGYADAQPISTSSELAALLMNKLNKTDASSQDLNRELSRLRAGSATIVIRQIIINEKSTSGKYQQLSVEMLPQGRGEDFPNPLITDYKTEDERRRVVNVFWSLLPVY